MTLSNFMCAALLMLTPCAAGAQTITTYAGTGTAGYTADGIPATSSAINSSWGIAIDTAGNLYIGDSPNQRVRKITPAGIITTIAGDGTWGFSGDGGAATAARVNNPSGIAADRLGNIYIADNGNFRIRKINAAGIITTIAGTGISGSLGDGGAATAARIFGPDGIAVDTAGNVYISSPGAIRKVDAATGIITRVAGDGTTGSYSGDGGPATAAQVGQSSDIDVDALGQIYFTDYPNHVVRKVDVGGIITTIAGTGVPGFSGDGGPATAATLRYPVGIDIDDEGNILIGDRDNSRIRKISAGGIITTIAGNGLSMYGGDGGPATNAALKSPHAVTHDACGNVYIADRLNSRIRKVDDSNYHFAGTLTAADTVCIGDSSLFSGTVTGGVWWLSNARAFITGTSTVVGVTTGLDTMHYAVSRYCDNDTASRPVYISASGACALRQPKQIVTEQEVVIYPNPCTQSFNVSVTGAAAVQVNLVICNMLGQPLMQQQVWSNRPNTIIHNLPAGIYIVVVTTNQAKYTRRLLVE